MAVPECNNQERAHQDFAANVSPADQTQWEAMAEAWEQGSGEDPYEISQEDCTNLILAQHVTDLLLDASEKEVLRQIQKELDQDSGPSNESLDSQGPIRFIQLGITLEDAQSVIVLDTISIHSEIAGADSSLISCQIKRCIPTIPTLLSGGVDFNPSLPNFESYKTSTCQDLPFLRPKPLQILQVNPRWWK